MTKLAAGSTDATDTQRLLVTRRKVGLSRIVGYTWLIGPGWLQSGLKLGGGAMTSSLYLGILSGFSLLWVHPAALLLGIIMLWALGYVVMCTGLRPFRAIVDHVNPVLGYGWIFGALIFSMVWDLPQYAIAYGALAQNLVPSVFSPNGIFGDFGGRCAVSVIVLFLCTGITWSYDSRGVGVRFFDAVLQALVWLKTLCFLGVVIKLGITDRIDWASVFHGLFVPDLSLLNHPARSYEKLLAPLSAEARHYWTGLLVRDQQDVIIASAATAAGINGTFLFGYSVLRRRWGREFLLFSKIDLLAGMLVPVTITTSCVVIASAHQFHTVYQQSLVAPGKGPPAPPEQKDQYDALLRARADHQMRNRPAPPAGEIESWVHALPVEERRMAAAIVTRDASDLAAALEPLTGPFFSRYLFGFGILGMCIGSIILHMTVCGMVVCELLNRPHTGWTYRLGSLVAAVGTLGPFLWSKAALWLAMPVSVFTYTLMPLTYLTFFFMMNSRRLLGEHLPTGVRRWAWNLAMGIALFAFGATSLWNLSIRGGNWALLGVVLFLGAAGVVHLRRRRSMATANLLPR